jgi:UDP-4-amino-4,6-dideoxy-N-acetyl-beta-L-altrosamine transaminase
MNPIPYGRHFISDEDIQAVTRVLQSDFLTQGPAIASFEQAFANYVGAQYAVAVANGTAALHLCAIALGVNETSTVITTPITFAASGNCIRYCGGQIDFADIDPNTLLIDLDQLETKLKNSPKGKYSGVVAVDFAGRAVDLERLRKIADAHGLWIIEDACHAPGGFFTDSKNNQQLCGNGKFAEAAIFSFHPVKHIACGEGGMITTNDKKLYDKLMMLRTHGITKDPAKLKANDGGWYYEMQELGYNYRLTDFQAALGESQLKRADAGLKRRREIAQRYDQAFKNTGIKIFNHASDNGHAYHLYVVHVPNRKKVYDQLRELNIYTQVHYIPVHTLPYYSSLGFRNGMYPNAEAYYEGCLSLPMFATLTDDEQHYVIEKLISLTK